MKTLMNVSKVVAIGALLVLAWTMFPSSAQAAVGDVQVRLSFEPFILMRYYSQVTITVSEAEMATYLTGAAATAVGEPATTADAVWGGTYFDADPVADVSDLTVQSTTNIPFRIPDAIRLWGFSSDGTVDVSVAEAAANLTLTGPAGSSVAIQPNTIEIDPGSGAVALPTNFALQGVNSVDCAISFEVDLTNLTKSGTYAAAGAQWTFTAVSP
jgi:hypothetical protein